MYSIELWLVLYFSQFSAVSFLRAPQTQIDSRDLATLRFSLFANNGHTYTPPSDNIDPVIAMHEKQELTCTVNHPTGTMSNNFGFRLNMFRRDAFVEARGTLQDLRCDRRPERDHQIGCVRRVFGCSRLEGRCMYTYTSFSLVTDTMHEIDLFAMYSAVPDLKEHVCTRIPRFVCHRYIASDSRVRHVLGFSRICMYTSTSVLC